MAILYSLVSSCHPPGCFLYAQNHQGNTFRGGGLFYFVSTANTGVSIGLLNARSDVHKATLIHDTIADRKLDVLALTETWVMSDAPDTVKLHPATRSSTSTAAHRPKSVEAASPSFMPTAFGSGRLTSATRRASRYSPCA